MARTDSSRIYARYKGAVVIRIQVAFESPNFDVPCKENEIKVSGILYRLISVVLL